MPSAAIAGITLDDGGHPSTGVYTDDESPRIDLAQYESGRGPCLDAWRQRRIVRIDDMRQAMEEYPEFARSAMEHGVGSTISLAMVIGGEGIGALNLYARTTNGSPRTTRPSASNWPLRRLPCWPTPPPTRGRPNSASS